MNKGRSPAERFNYIAKTLHVSAEWVQGFVDGEGCFYVFMNKKPNKNNSSCIATLEISQKFHDIKV